MFKKIFILLNLSIISIQPFNYNLKPKNNCKIINNYFASNFLSLPSKDNNQLNLLCKIITSSHSSSTTEIFNKSLDNHNHTLIHLLIIHNKSKLLKQILNNTQKKELEIILNKTDKYENNALDLAILYGDLNTLKIIYSKTKEVNRIIKINSVKLNKNYIEEKENTYKNQTYSFEIKIIGNTLITYDSYIDTSLSDFLNALNIEINYHKNEDPYIEIKKKAIHDKIFKNIINDKLIQKLNVYFNNIPKDLSQYLDINLYTNTISLEDIINSLNEFIDNNTCLYLSISSNKKNLLNIINEIQLLQELNDYNEYIFSYNVKNNTGTIEQKNPQSENLENYLEAINLSHLNKPLDDYKALKNEAKLNNIFKKQLIKILEVEILSYMFKYDLFEKLITHKIGSGGFGFIESFTLNDLISTAKDFIKQESNDTKKKPIQDIIKKMNLLLTIKNRNIEYVAKKSKNNESGFLEIEHLKTNEINNRIVTRIHYYHKKDGIIVMRKKNIDIDKYIENNENLDKTKQLFLMKNISQKSAYLYSQLNQKHFYHMDVKNGNIMINNHNELKLIDMPQSVNLKDLKKLLEMEKNNENISNQNEYNELLIKNFRHLSTTYISKELYKLLDTNNEREKWKILKQETNSDINNMDKYLSAIDCWAFIETMIIDLEYIYNLDLSNDLKLKNTFNKMFGDNLQKNLPTLTENDIKSFINDLCDKLAVNNMWKIDILFLKDLLEKGLDLNYKTRITMEEISNHPFMNDYFTQISSVPNNIISSLNLKTLISISKLINNILPQASNINENTDFRKHHNILISA